MPFGRQTRAVGGLSRKPVSVFLVMLTVTVVAAIGFLVGEFSPDGSYVCNQPLEDLRSPRPPVRNTEFFDAARPCWDAARRRVVTASVVTPVGVVAAAGTALLVRRGRIVLAPLALYFVVTFVALGTGWGTRY